MDGQLNEQDAVGFKAKLKLHQDSGSDVTLPPSARHASSNTTNCSLHSKPKRERHIPGSTSAPTQEEAKANHITAQSN